MSERPRAEILNWTVHTRHLLEEVLENNTTGPLKRPIQLFDQLLRHVARRAAQLHDPTLDSLMIALTLYSIADPESPDYNSKIVEGYGEIRREWEKGLE